MQEKSTRYPEIAKNFFNVAILESRILSYSRNAAPRSWEPGQFSSSCSSALHFQMEMESAPAAVVNKTGVGVAIYKPLKQIPVVT